MHPQEVEINACPSVWITGTIWLLLQETTCKKLDPFPNTDLAVFDVRIMISSVLVSIPGADHIRVLSVRAPHANRCLQTSWSLTAGEKTEFLSFIHIHFLYTVRNRCPPSPFYFPGICCKGALFVTHGMWETGLAKALYLVTLGGPDTCISALWGNPSHSARRG